MIEKSVNVRIINKVWSHRKKHIILAILFVHRVNMDMGLSLLWQELLRFLVKDTRLNESLEIIYGITCKKLERFRSPCMQFESC